MQTKPFNINQTMRDKVANQLMLQAIAQHGERIALDLAAFNKQFWAAHRSKVEALPGLDKKHWASLIQAGAVTATSTVRPEYMKPREGEQPRKCELVGIYDEYDNEMRNHRVTTMLASEAFAGVVRYLKHSRYSPAGWVINLVSTSGSVPRLHGMELITDPGMETLGLMICADITAVMEAGLAFRQQAMDVLLACRTSRQVEDLFPEAAKLLPQPVKNDKAVAPTELAASVRSMLSKGVPPVTAQV
ncbi:hypothetical protein [Pseudomonas sp. Marseille-Q8238]